MTTNVQDEDGVLPVMLQLLREECEAEAFSSAVQTLLKIFRNIQNNPTEEKYRSIRLENAAFAQKVWRHDGCQQFLQATGWVIVEESIYLTEDSHVTQAVIELEKNLNAAQPAAQAAVGEMKEMSDARRKQLEQLKRQKEERRKIAEQIKNDRQEANSRPTRDIRARERRFGAQIKRFEDIGVDLNSGGG